MDYLHWIGKQYYTMNSFAKEAARYGVTRRISLNVAKKMSFGDKVYCAMLDGKTGVIFGYFIISKLSGLSQYATSLITSTHENKQVDEGGDIIIRGCGEYTEGNEYVIRCELPDIISTLDDANNECVDIGHPMVGGMFFTIPKIRLINIPFRQGFRTIDAKALLHEAAHYHNKVYGQFYVPLEDADPFSSHPLKECGWVQAVEDYQQKKGGRRNK